MAKFTFEYTIYCYLFPLNDFIYKIQLEYSMYEKLKL